MQYPDWREEEVGHAGELVPAEERVLTAPFECLEPAPANLSDKPPQARIVARDSVVVEMPFEHLSHPRAGLRDGVMHSFAQLHLDRLQLSYHPLLDRLAPDDERAPCA